MQVPKHAKAILHLPFSPVYPFLCYLCLLSILSALTFSPTLSGDLVTIVDVFVYVHARGRGSLVPRLLARTRTTCRPEEVGTGNIRDGAGLRSGRTD